MEVKKTKEIVASETTQVDSFIQTALANNAPVETLERLFALHQKVEESKAKAAFVQSLADFQKEVPVIQKTKKVLNKDGRSLRYQFAPLDAIVSQIRGPLAKNGLSYTWTVENMEGAMTATAKITHVMGHSETSSFKIPIDKEGYMTEPQKYASAQTFAKRYALCNALGISTGEEDTDATDVKKEKGPKNKKAEIVLLLRRLGKDTTQKETVVADVKDLTELDLEEKNFNDIADRLALLVNERESYDNSDVQQG